MQTTINYALLFMRRDAMLYMVQLPITHEHWLKKDNKSLCLDLCIIAGLVGVAEERWQARKGLSIPSPPTGLLSTLKCLHSAQQFFPTGKSFRILLPSCTVTCSLVLSLQEVMSLRQSVIIRTNTFIIDYLEVPTCT